MAQAIAHQRDCRFADASALYARVLEAEPNYAEAAFNLAVIHRIDGELGDAERCLKRALAIKSDYVEAFFLLALVNLEQGKHQEARRLARHAISLFPTYLEAHNLLGLIAWAENDFTAAAEAFAEASLLDPDFFDAKRNLLAVNEVRRRQPGRRKRAAGKLPGWLRRKERHVPPPGANRGETFLASKHPHVYASYDHLLGYAHPDSSADPGLHLIAGFDIWPAEMNSNRANTKLMILGGSTSDCLTGCRWPAFLARLANAEVGPLLVMNGGCGGYSSNQELLKLLRDAPALRPDVVISLSGINDIGFCWSMPQTPMIHPYQAKLAEFVVSTTRAFEQTTNGLPQTVTAHDHWLRNTRLMKAAAADLGAQYLAFLQPCVGVCDFSPDEKEKAMLNEVLEGRARIGYLEDMRCFYEGVRARLAEHPHVVDITDVFRGRTSVYADLRHPNDSGNELIARRVLDEIRARGWIES
jgi:Flp pilus assembly protein TadD/lysophospholipase L1-like esterase